MVSGGSLAAGDLPLPAGCGWVAPGILLRIGASQHDGDVQSQYEHNECDVCSAIESGDYNLSKQVDTDFNLDATLAFEHVFCLPIPASAERCILISSRAPPCLAKRCAFMIRAAILGRTPFFFA